MIRAPTTGRVLRKCGTCSVTEVRASGRDGATHHRRCCSKSSTADYLVGHPAPPHEFVAVDGLTLAGQQVRTRSGHLAQTVGVQPVGDQLALVLLPLPPMQSLLDEAFGSGVIRLDDVQYVRWAAHEAFHIYQLGAIGDDPPRFGFDGSEMEMVTTLAATDGFSEQLEHEGALLASALDTETDASLREAVKAFLGARAQRRASLDPALAGFEQAVEWTEGLARYTDVRLLQAAGGPDYLPTGAFSALGARYPTPQATWTEATHWLDDLSSIPGTIRDRYYELGAAEAYLLDRLMPGWHARALPGGESLEVLLREGLEAATAGSPPSRSAHPLADLSIGDGSDRAAVADSPLAWSCGLAGVDDFGSARRTLVRVLATGRNRHST